MKQNLIRTVICLLIFGGLALSSACKDDDKIDGPAPDILYQVETMHVDLNSSLRPAVISVINSEVGLKSVTAYILKTGESEQQFGNAVTAFTNANSYSISAAVTFTEDMTGFKIVAIDRNGQQSVKELALDIVPLRDPPAVVFNGDQSLSQLTYTEGSPMPSLTFTVSSEEALNYVVISEVVNRSESIIPVAGSDTIKFTAGEKEYEMDMVSTLAYTFRNGITAVKVSVGAGAKDNMKLKIATLYVNYIAIPAPVITFDNTDDVIDINESKPLTITGKIKAEGKANLIRFFTRDASNVETEIPGSKISLSPSVVDYNFTLNIPSIAAGVKSVVVRVEDDLSKSTDGVKKLNVIELVPAPTITLTTTAANLNGLAKNAPFTIAGNVTSLGVITSVKIIVTDNQGVATEHAVSINDVKNVNLSALPITATATMAKVQVKAVDENGKTTLSDELNMYVGYSYHRVLVSSSGFDKYNDPLLLPFFSATNTTGYSYEDAMANNGVVDIGFSSWGGNTQIGVVNIPTADSNKFNHPTARPTSSNWPSRRTVKLKEETSIVKRSNFDIATIDDMLSIQTPTGSGQYYLTSGSYDNPKDISIAYDTNINGASKRVVFCYDQLEKPLTEAAPISGSRFYIKVKIEK